MLHTVVALVHDRPGVLNRAVSLFRRRAINIHSLTVGTTENPALSRITVVVERDSVEHVVRQLERLIDVAMVRDITSQRSVEREMCLVRVAAPAARLGELVTIAGEYSARLLGLTRTTMIVSAMDTPERVSSLVQRLQSFEIRELARSGRIAMAVDNAAAESAGPTPQHARSHPGPAAALPTNWQADGAGDYEAA
ncbi:MAG: acetolactate synthase small subunit [Gemmatimonadaceae bacterium]